MMPAFRFAIAAALLLCASPFAHAITIPVNDGYVTDEAGILADEEEAQIEDVIREYETQTTNQIAIVILPNLEGEDIVESAVEIGRAWGVGTEKNNGIIMLMGYEEREIMIATGYGLEGAVPDIVAKGIIDTDIVPAFRDGEYAEGFLAAIESLKKHIGGEYTAERYESSDAGGAISWVFFALFIFFDVIAAFLSRSKSWWMGGIFGGIFGIILTILYSWWISIPVLVVIGLVLDYLLSKGGGGGNGRWRGPGGFGGPRFGSGSSSGGFKGFGGGSFGGGGARGKW